MPISFKTITWHLKKLIQKNLIWSFKKNMPPKFKKIGIYFKCHDKNRQEAHFCCSERGLVGEEGKY
jgi:hypothetical protein